MECLHFIKSIYALSIQICITCDIYHSDVVNMLILCNILIAATFAVKTLQIRETTTTQ